MWLPWDPSEHLMPEVEYAEKELNELMRKYKENEVNREIFFEEEKTAKMEAQRKENEARRRQALEDAKKDNGVADAEDLSQAIQLPVHPAEGGAPRDL
jgi:AAA15 family ATPase/GTPase